MARPKKKKEYYVSEAIRTDYTVNSIPCSKISSISLSKCKEVCSANDIAIYNSTKEFVDGLRGVITPDTPIIVEMKCLNKIAMNLIRDLTKIGFNSLKGKKGSEDISGDSFQFLKNEKGNTYYIDILFYKEGRVSRVSLYNLRNLIPSLSYVTIKNDFKLSVDLSYKDEFNVDDSKSSLIKRTIALSEIVAKLVEDKSVYLTASKAARVQFFKGIKDGLRETLSSGYSGKELTAEVNSRIDWLFPNLQKCQVNGGYLSSKNGEDDNEEIELLSDEVHSLLYKLDKCVDSDDEKKLFKKISECRKGISRLYENIGKVSLDEIIRKSYMGGLCFLNRNISGEGIEHIGRRIYVNRPGAVYDCNSIYPYASVCGEGYDITKYNFGLLPVGTPIAMYADKNHTKLWSINPRDVNATLVDNVLDYTNILKDSLDVPSYCFYTIKVDMDIKDDVVVPFYRDKIYKAHKSKWANRDINNMLVTTKNSNTLTDNYVIMTVSEDDLETLKACYNVHNIIYLDSYVFEAVPGVFDEYFGLRIENKVNFRQAKEFVLAIMEKIRMNSLIGSMGKKPNRRSGSSLDEYGRVDMQESETSTIAIQTASAILSKARRFYVDCINANIKNYVYGDTDAMHLIGDGVVPSYCDVDETKLGSFKVEKKFLAAVYIGAKTYALATIDDEGNIHHKLTAAGIPTEVAMAYEAMMDGNEEYIYSVAKHIDGAIEFYESQKAKGISGLDYFKQPVVEIPFFCKDYDTPNGTVTIRENRVLDRLEE